MLPFALNGEGGKKSASKFQKFRHEVFTLLNILIGIVRPSSLLKSKQLHQNF